MKLSGEHLVQAPPATVWNLLMDPQVLARITPGIDKLELVEQDKYKAIADVKIGPVRGSFSGEVQVKDKHPNDQFTLAVHQASKIGNADADIILNLADKEGATALSFEGDVRLSGMIATMGQRVVSGVASMLSKQFFAALDKEVESNPD